VEDSRLQRKYSEFFSSFINSSKEAQTLLSYWTSNILVGATENLKVLAH